jgi:tetratricopeptide (TPR) repeat protein
LHPSPPSPASTEEWIAEARRIAGGLADSLPHDPAALALAGRIVYTFGDSDKATAWWRRCLEVRPGFREALCGLGLSAWEQGDFPKAVDLLRQGTEGDARLLDAHVFCLADSLMNIGRAEETTLLLEKAGPQRLSPAGLVVLGQAYLETGDYQRARQRFESALAKAPDLGNAHYGLATALAGLGKTEEAEEQRRQYARRKQRDLAAYDRARKAELTKDRADPAEVRRLVAGFCVDAGQIYAQNGRPEQTEAHWLKAAAYDPEDPRPRELLRALAQ